MVTRFGKPCVIITTDGSTAKGSCRSVKDFSIHEMLKHCGDLTIKFGGHSGAGGLTIEDKNIDSFRARVLQYAKDKFPTMPAAQVIADCCPESADITVDNVEKLDALQPFGEGNPLPIFCLTNCLIKYKRPLKEGKYTSFNVDYNGREFKVLDFSRQYADFWYKVGDSVDLMLNFSINEYNGSKDISMKIADIRLCGINQDRYFAAKNTYEQIARSEFEDIDSNLYQRIIPTNTDMKKVYDIIKDSFCLEQVSQSAVKSGINYCMLRVIIDVFTSAGLIEFNRVSGNIKVVKGAKADLEKSDILVKLKQRSTG
jgi:single-stranded-DNA-specific exonuclease